MNKKTSLYAMYISVLVLMVVLIYQNMSLKTQIEYLQNNLSSLQSSTNVELSNIRQILYEQEQASRPSYGENARVVETSGTKRALDVEVQFSLKELETSAEVYTTAKDENGVTTSARSEYNGGVYTAVLRLDAAKTYSILYESKGAKTVSGELFSYYQPKAELLNRFKVDIGRFSEDKNGFELHPSIYNSYNGTNMLKINSAKLVVIEQTPGESVQEIDLMPYITDSDTAQRLATGYDEQAELAAMAGDTTYTPPSERLQSFGFSAPETSDYTIKIIITDNLGYTYTHTETINRRPNVHSASEVIRADFAGGYSGTLQIS